jgi:hypothetical protein
VFDITPLAPEFEFIYKIWGTEMRVTLNTDHLKKSPTRGGKTMLNGFATPSRIFGLAFKPKKIAKNMAYFINLLQS